MQHRASVVLCTHNPRMDYLGRVLEALRSQTLPIGLWELLVIDNASREPVSPKISLEWHQNARALREDTLGKTMALVRGIRESVGELVVVVDDDNVLSPNYLETTSALAERHPYIGAFGGSIRGVFEEPPPAWSEPYLHGLAIEEIDRNYWANLHEWSKAVPFGAGMCVRRAVAEDYANKVLTDPKRRLLDRKGSGLQSHGDTDLAWCAVDLGMGTARFCSLKMTHLISKERLTQDYIARLFGAFDGSYVILLSIRADKLPEPDSQWRTLRRRIRNFFVASPLQRKIQNASLESRLRAFKLLTNSGT